MELMTKQGYKQTELGVIPTDWIITDLNSLVDKKRTIRYGIVQPGKYDPNGKFLIRGQDYSFGWVNPEDFFRVSPQIEEPYKNARVKKGDVIITIVGASTGKVEIIPFWLDQSNLTQTTARIAIDNNKGDNNYIKYYLESKKGQEQVKNYIKGAAQPGLNCGDIEKFLTILPPTLNEQKAIANALSDVDALITSLEQTITKKKAIKQGAMQQLLTPPHKGGKRLPGFTGEWEEKKFGEVFNFKQGLQCAVEEQFETEKNNRVRFVRIIDLTNNNEPPRYISKPDISHIIKEEDLFMVRYGSPGLLGFGFTGVIANNLFRLIPRIQVSTKFFFHLLQYRNQDILNLSSSTTMAAISFGPLTNMELVLPVHNKEQKAIAKILSDMDAEINQLETKKEKYQAIKQGMMQELLTGKTRLI